MRRSIKTQQIPPATSRDGRAAPRGRRGPSAGPRQGLIIAVLAFAGMGASFMQTILIPIQGELPELLNSTRGTTAWVITVTLLVSAICTPISGKLGDMYGKRRTALVLLSILVAGSLISALSPNAAILIIGRGLQGAGMGVIPLGISILRDTLDKDRLGSAIALISATLGVGGAVGLPVSALIVEHFDWHVLFWVATAIGTLSLVLIARFVPADTLRTGGRFDFVGALGLAAGLTGVLLAVSRGNEWGWAAPATLALLGGGLAILLLWGWYEMRVSNPLVDLRVSARAPVLLTNLASIAMGFALFSSSVVFPQLLELPAQYDGLGLSLLHASLILMPAGLAMLAMSPVAGRIERRTGPKPLFIAGGVTIALTYAAAALLPLQTWHILLINTVIGIGIGLGYAAMPTLIMQAVPANETGAANGLNTLMRALGTSIASAVVAGVLAQSAIDVGAGAPVPTADGFQVAFVLGLTAALVCTLIAVFIPHPTREVTRDAALPEGSLAATDSDGEVVPAGTASNVR
ncbi:MFS transporter [Polymorphospora rubra]|uniref:MFS transporter n=1 Tax=Polymorphospora rubra TaxID=338584 RepID=A0A810N6K5_9ACTN|nr:MFS transporter [Polymorphospora rubra]BCJ67273.1 MFS transporter [Polymorphospora rubra]